jgi:glycosyltransferase involved in cell wall biosynthesis
MIPDVLSEHDIGVLPFPNVKKMNVSSAIKMFEYLAAGMPIIATKIQAHEKVLNGKEFVFWSKENHISIAQAIMAAAISKEKLKVFGEQARKYSQNWSWEKSGEKLSNSLNKSLLLL